jgi:hypothetical protein
VSIPHLRDAVSAMYTGTLSLTWPNFGLESHISIGGVDTVCGLTIRDCMECFDSGDIRPDPRS